MPYQLLDLEGESGQIVCFESYGVRVGISSNYPEFLSRIAGELDQIFPTDIAPIENKNIERLIAITRRDDGFIEFNINGESESGSKSEENVFKFLLSRIRLTVAEFASSRVFVHAGVVVWKQKALIFPGNSFSGKTTLVKALIEKGASYFSDEYAIFDENGLVHPYPKTLSIRGIVDDYTQVEHTAEQLGAVTDTEPRPAGMILFSEYEEGSEFNPKPLTTGEAVLKTVSYTLPIRVAPAFSLEVLQKAASGAITCETTRGEAEKAAPLILNYFEKHQQ